MCVCMHQNILKYSFKVRFGTLVSEWKISENVGRAGFHVCYAVHKCMLELGNCHYLMQVIVPLTRCCSQRDRAH